MKVILNVDVKGSGKAGELVEVSDGYARNFLLPRKLAVEANTQSMNEFHGREAAKQHRAEVELEDAQKAAKTLEGKIVHITAKAGENGRLFGAVTAKEIAGVIKDQFSVHVEKRKIVLGVEIRAYGTYPIEVHLHPGVAAKMSVSVGEPD